MSRCLTPGLPSPKSEEEVSWRSLVAQALLASPRTQSQASGDGAWDWGSSARRVEWPEVRISGHAAELHWGAAPSTPGIEDPEGQPEPPSLGSGRSPTDAAESQAQSPVTPEPSVASGLGARKLCPETAQVKLGSEGGSFLSSPSSLRGSLPFQATVPAHKLFPTHPVLSEPCLRRPARSRGLAG